MALSVGDLKARDVRGTGSADPVRGGGDAAGRRGFPDFTTGRRGFPDFTTAKSGLTLLRPDAVHSPSYGR